MADINIKDLAPAGSDLLQDSESFLNELTDSETSGIEGGIVADVLSLLPGTPDLLSASVSLSILFL